MILAYLMSPALVIWNWIVTLRCTKTDQTVQEEFLLVDKILLQKLGVCIKRTTEQKVYFIEFSFKIKATISIFCRPTYFYVDHYVSNPCRPTYFYVYNYVSNPRFS